jgi:hydrogenase-4 membrane subunit HyfE
VILWIYLLALARFCTAWAALETGSAFEGMGAAREVSYAVITEAAIISAVLTLSLQSSSVSLNAMLTPSFGSGGVLLAGGLFAVLLAENCRVPFDDPNTHLELTMIHEVMVLDHSGPPLAVILHGASMKLLMFSLLLVQAVVPMEGLAAGTRSGVLVLGVLLVMLGVGLAESLMARLAFRRVPLLLTTAFLLCVFAAVQGMLLGTMPMVIEREPSVLLLLIAVATIAIKGLVIPSLLRKAMRTANIDRDLSPLVSYVPSLLLGAAGMIGAVTLANRLPLLPEHHESLLVAGSLASVFTGLLLLVGRSKAISQVCGYLILENGIYLFGLLLLHSVPLLVEGGILLDLTVAVFVIGIIVDRIQRAFDTLDTRKLTVLRE